MKEISRQDFDNALTKFIDGASQNPYTEVTLEMLSNQDEGGKYLDMYVRILRKSPLPELLEAASSIETMNGYLQTHPEAKVDLKGKIDELAKINSQSLAERALAQHSKLSEAGSCVIL